MALISVIVPCYNTEKYIDRCIKSIVSQTIGIENLEIILVNDASTDGTLLKLQEWEKKYPENILVVTYDQNLRQGGARNVGMQYATGTYIGFVDSDDYIAADMYECLYDRAILKNYSMVSGKVEKDLTCSCDEMNSGGFSKSINFKEYIYSYNGEWYEQPLNEIIDEGSVCSGIYLREMLIDNNLWFPENMAYEDNYWSSVLKLFLPNLCVIDKVVYYYCINAQSTVQTKNAIHQLDRLDIEIMILEKYKEMGAFEYYRPYLRRNFIRRFYLNTLHLLFTRFDYMPNVFGYMKEKILEYFPDYEEYEDDNVMVQALIGLLKIERELSVEELETVKMNYLKLK